MVHWLITFILGFIAGVGAFLIWLWRICNRIEEAERKRRAAELAGKEKGGGD